MAKRRSRGRDDEAEGPATATGTGGTVAAAVATPSPAITPAPKAPLRASVTLRVRDGRFRSERSEGDIPGCDRALEIFFNEPVIRDQLLPVVGTAALDFVLETTLYGHPGWAIEQYDAFTRIAQFLIHLSPGVDALEGLELAARLSTLAVTLTVTGSPPDPAGGGLTSAGPGAHTPAVEPEQKREQEDPSAVDWKTLVPVRLTHDEEEQLERELRELSADVTAAHDAAAGRLEGILARRAKRGFGDAEKSRKFAGAVVAAAGRIERRFECPECHELGTFGFAHNKYRINHRSTTHTLGEAIRPIKTAEAGPPLPDGPDA